MSVIAGHRSQPFTEAEKSAIFPDTLSFYRDNARRERVLRRMAWAGCAAGVIVGVAGMISAASLFPLKRTEVRWIEVDKSTGYVGESIGVTDAPKLFSDLVAHQYVRAYVEAREGYTPATDQYFFRKTQLLSAADERARYVAWHNKDMTAPLRAVGPVGHIEVANFHPVKRSGAGDKVLIYDVRFDRQVTHGQTIDPWEHWTATVQFVWRPDLILTADERMLNVAGMQVVAYTASKDSADAQ